ncbi:carboxylesterase family protein [Amycolatopsis rhabdoformis]|uniref:Carboxylic ester hydrolase n=1 Tax=Amycolatopsis rhabdoformis TaxID=1448059 RepID=A0ABZ1I0T3_9PSEU|nr:carboxylesterase family protein [Amycolatopsis rhabdoformis]WSE27815.1 carboxylesterase family protein [Amycolatopsis rhabdoformis]
MIVETTSGQVRGVNGAFRGIPYAQQERFAPPTKAPAWTGVRDALEPGPAAIQLPSRLAAVIGPMELAQSEDCLSLNVFTPSTTGARPVLVWIHGGAFLTGSGGQGWYDGTRLATEADVVVVTVNYRLGVLGFLPLDGVAPPNLGIADQLAALEWVRDNAAAFGGDPGRVTLAGQSAGAQSTLTLWSAPRAQGLVHQIALQSPPVGLPPQTPDEAAGWADKYLHALGATGPAELTTMPTDRLLDGLKTLAAQLGGGIAPPFQLVADHDLVPDNLITAAKPGRALVSWTRDEVRAFTPDAPQEQVDAMTTSLFSGDLPRLMKQLGEDATLMRFDWAAPGNRYGACHCIDVPFLFGNGAPGAACLDGAPNPPESDDLRKLWARFLHGERPAVDSPLLTAF